MLTAFQQRAFAFIAERLNTTSVAPTRKEMCEALDCSRSYAQLAVDRLVEHGLLRRMPGRMQALDLVRVQYFRFDDESKQLVEWQHHDQRGNVPAGHRSEGGQS